MSNLARDQLNNEPGGTAAAQQPPQNQQRPQSPGDGQYSTAGPQHQDYIGPAGVPNQGVDLAPNVAAMLSYLLFGWIGGLIMYLTQKDREVRFHAAQSILTFGGLTIIMLGIDIAFSVMFIYTGVFLLGLSWVISLLSFVLWIFLSIQGYRLKHIKLPIIGSIAERWAAA
jgi:uncharacterized membrane protein